MYHLSQSHWLVKAHQESLDEDPEISIANKVKPQFWTLDEEDVSTNLFGNHLTIYV